jgi:hypothetical protein
MARPGSGEQTLAELRRWNHADIDRWSSRNERFKKDQELFQLRNPAEGVSAQNAKDVLILPDPRILVYKIARLIARHPNVIEVPPAPGMPVTPAQKIENYLYLWDQGINQRWMMGGHHPYRFDQSFFQVLRGWGTERTMLYPEGMDDISGDPSAFYDHQVFDPVNVYPFWAGGRLRRVTHMYKVTAAELLEDPFLSVRSPAKDEDFPDDKAVFEIRATYWEAEGTWWHAVTGNVSGLSRSDDAEWVKEPVELGYNPWTITLANGASNERTPWDDLTYLEELGVGVLDNAGSSYTYLNRMATKLNELLTLESNPPVSLFSRNGQIRPVKFFPGARNVFAEKDRLEAHRIGPALGDYQLLWDILSQRAARSGLPPTFYGEYGGESGFSATALVAAGRDILSPFTDAVNQADALKYRKVLELYRDFGPGRPLRSKLAPNGLGEVQSAEITAEEITAQGTYVQITREDMTPQEMAQRVQMALSMIQAKAISLETARKDWLKVRNPAGENLKVLAEQVYLSEDVIRALIPLTLSATGRRSCGGCGR